jgi:hypothetical protein
VISRGNHHYPNHIGPSVRTLDSFTRRQTRNHVFPDELTYRHNATKVWWWHTH